MERECDGRISFVDVLLDHRGDDINFSVYRKPTHTDLYVHRLSAHPPHVFFGVTRGLWVRAQRICSDQNLADEKRHLRGVLRRNGYDEATISRGLSTRSPRVCGEAEPGTRRRSLPFIPEVSEKISRILRNVGVFTAMKPQRTIRSQLVRKRPEKAKTLGAVYLDARAT